ncbi:MAG: pilin [Pseudomonadota bacterium]
MRGFTLIELMVVTAIIGILAAIAVPRYSDYIIRAQMVEVFALTNELKPAVQSYYLERGRFPANNTQAGIPLPKQLIGNFVTQIEIVDGAMHVTLGNYVHQELLDHVVTVRPVVVTGSPTSPIAWGCGSGEPPPGMEAVGEDRTDVEAKYLPRHCNRRAGDLAGT